MVELRISKEDLRRPVHLNGKLGDVAGRFDFAGQKFETSFSGEIGLIFGLSRERTPSLHLDTLNLVGKSVPHERGETGRLSVVRLGQRADPMTFDWSSGRFEAEFDVRVHVPAVDRIRGFDRVDEHTFVGHTAVARARMTGEFAGRIRPRRYGVEMMRAELRIDVPGEERERLLREFALSVEFIVPIQWFFVLAITRRLPLQPVFIGSEPTSPWPIQPPTGASFYPLVDRANQIWQKCCIQFDVRCPPIYLAEPDYRVLTENESYSLIDEVSVEDAIEVFVVERWTPEDTFGGGATFSSGTAEAKIVTADSNLPLNQNHLAHELGHVLGLGHPNSGSSLTPGCDDSVMEPSGFYADNPDEQCYKNCRMANNPLICSHPHQQWCAIGPISDEEDLF